MGMSKGWLVVGPLLLAGGAIGCGRTDFKLGADAGVGGSPGQPSLADAALVPVSSPDAALVPDLAPPIGPDLAPDLRGLTCGNGRFDPGEECDDGNTLPGDGCDGSCILECNWSDCPKPPFILPVVCGDRVVDQGEGCDDGNATSGDGCSANCTVEPGWKCVVPGRRCTPICGDGLVVGTETCDDRNQTSGDGCSYLCLVEPCWTCSGDVCQPRLPAVDGGNCRGLPVAFCGDGILQGAEECDQGIAENTVVYGSLTACSPRCTLPHYCGDGYVDADYGEECDLGDANRTGSYCTPICRIWMP
jgi:cysteine-rich repeat protein